MEGWFKLDHPYQPEFFSSKYRTEYKHEKHRFLRCIWWQFSELCLASPQHDWPPSWNLFTQFHFLISQFNTVPQPPNRSLQLYSLLLSNPSKRPPPKHSWKLTLNLCLRGFFFSAFQFSTSVVFSLLQHIQKCVQLIGTHLERQRQGATLSSAFSRGLLRFHVVCGLWWWCLPNEAVAVI